MLHMPVPAADTGLPADPNDIAAPILQQTTVRALRRAVASLIDLLDTLEPDCDLEEDDPPGDDAGRGCESADMEPSLASPEDLHGRDQSNWARGGDQDREFDGDTVADPDLEDGHDREGVDEDAEPSLAATNDINHDFAWLGHVRGYHLEDGESDGCEDDLGAAYVTREQSAATAIEKDRLTEALRGIQDADLRPGRMFRLDEDVRMPDGTRVMGYVR